MNKKKKEKKLKEKENKTQTKILSTHHGSYMAYSDFHLRENERKGKRVKGLHSNFGTFSSSLLLFHDLLQS